jgi:hypothetical protein
MPLGKAWKGKVLHIFLYRYALSPFSKKYHDGRKTCHEVSQTKSSQGADLLSSYGLRRLSAHLQPTRIPLPWHAGGLEESGNSKGNREWTQNKNTPLGLTYYTYSGF